MPDQPLNGSGSPGPLPDPENRGETGGDNAAFLTLENIIDMTGELEHLNELVMLHLARDGAFTGQKSYFTVVMPILDRLEGEIRGQSRAGLGRDELKDLIGCWIDREIALIR